MKPPSFETHQDQKREERVAGFLEGLWNVSCFKLPVSYALDYWIESKERCYWCEVKCRTFEGDKYDTFIISAKKFRKGASYAESTKVPFILVYAMKDSVWCHEYDPKFKYDLRMNVNTSPESDEDNEPFVHIPKDKMICLSDKPLGMDRNEIGIL
jgi:hypothetical protein|tara:strand:- start:883 stop:1347 length:465 start_codon:yes stop_codon:yes gene_type:complete